MNELEYVLDLILKNESEYQDRLKIYEKRRKLRAKGIKIKIIGKTHNKVK